MGVIKAHGGVAQLGEHLPCKQGVRSSILLVSTIPEKGSLKKALFFENYIEERNVRKISREIFLRTKGKTQSKKKLKSN